MKKLILAMALGAALAWLFDPDTGSRRRTSLKRKLDQSGVTAPASAKPVAPTTVTNHTPAAVATIP